LRRSNDGYQDREEGNPPGYWPRSGILQFMLGWRPVVFAPFMAQIRFLAFRLATLREERRAVSMRTILAQGVPLATSAALFLLVAQDWLGRLYGQHGPWWSALIESLAISLPLRFAANVLRALLQSLGDFASVAAADSAALWLLATPLVALGLYADSPVVAYLSLILPEAVCAVWLWRRLRRSRRLDPIHVTAEPFRL
jgi:Na+-driven multidrug efflux pump